MTNRKTLKRLPVLFLAGLSVASAQSDPGAIFTVEARDYVIYWDDIGDPSRFATDPGVTTARRPRNFDRGLGVADIYAINGTPVKGTFNYVTSILSMNSVPTPGQALVDTLSRGATLFLSYDIQAADGTQIGTIWAAGFAGPVPPPGVSEANLAQNLAIIGGTGAFLGARGQINSVMGTAASRSASVTEDPANRKQHGGGARRDVFHILPAQRPAITSILHGSDFSPVTETNPARRGETLVLAATGLGPVRANVVPGAPFPQSPPAEVNSPLEAHVNGASAVVINKIGWPNLVGSYRVDIRVPESTSAGIARVRLTAAWISSADVSFPVRD
jgi:uncharacterized protein (TIGR03437 family)